MRKAVLTTFRPAQVEDAKALAQMNLLLIQDEGHRNRMNLSELERRMAGWLAAEYSAALFVLGGEPIGYALYRHDEQFTYLRQFFVRREWRRHGVGRAAFQWLLDNTWATSPKIRLDVLVGNEMGIAFWRTLRFRDYCITMELDRS